MEATFEIRERHRRGRLATVFHPETGALSVAGRTAHRFIRGDKASEDETAELSTTHVRILDHFWAVNGLVVCGEMRGVSSGNDTTPIPTPSDPIWCWGQVLAMFHVSTALQIAALDDHVSPENV